MAFLALLGIGLLIAILVVPWIAFAKAGAAQTALVKLEKEFRGLSKRFNEAMAQIALLQQTIDGLQTRGPLAEDVAVAAKNAAIEAPPAIKVASIPEPIKPATPVEDGLTRSEWSMPTAASAEQIENTQPLPPIATSSNPPSNKPSSKPSNPVAAAPQYKPTPPRSVRIAPHVPSDFEVQIGKWLAAGKEWLFGGNLVAKVGLIILIIGAGFLVRLAANYVTVPVEVRLAGIAAAAIALLAWGWRIRESRRGIALPAQGAALAILMLVTFGAYKLIHLPSGATFAMLFVLVAFTCLLAVLQDAIWLAIFGIVGGFAAPILISTGSNNYVGLFSYYCILNIGIVAIAFKRSWRALNLLGFAFTFVIGAAWGADKYVPDNYSTTQPFLIAFWLFYIVIAVLFAWRRAPQLKSYVDGTLVFGVPMAGMALQYGLVKDIPYGMSISALTVALTYAITASVLWRWRQGNLRLLVESFLALGVVFGTLAIPLAFDGRWTSAAWAVEGAAIVWIGLKQKQKLAWQFGVAVQLGSWISFVSALTGLNPLAALRGNVGLGFLLLGGTGVLMALMFRRHGRTEVAAEEKSRQRFGWMASGFISVAVLWLLLGMWVEVWLRMEGAQRASLLVLTALGLVFGLQFLSKKSQWHLPDVLGGGVAGVAGIVFAALMIKHMEWNNFHLYPERSFGELLTNGPLLGGLMLCAGALVSAFAFRNRQALVSSADKMGDKNRAAQTTMTWLLLAVFWWCGFALHGIAHAVAYLTSINNDVDAVAWYSVSFWGAYGIGLSLSALAWTTLALRKQFPNPRWMLLVFWPALTALGALAFWNQVADTVWWLHRLGVSVQMTMSDAWLTLLAGPLAGALILCGLAWHGIFRIAQGVVPTANNQSDAASAHGKAIGVGVWLIGLGLAWYLIALDAIALFIASALGNIGIPDGTPDSDAWWQLGYMQVGLLLFVASAMAFLPLAKRKQLLAMRWLAIPAAAWQALASAYILMVMYLQGELPSVRIAITLLGVWLGMTWCLRYWQRNDWRTSTWSLRALHFGRVIAPWLVIAPLISLLSMSWLAGETPEQISTLEDQGWIVNGMWSDYLAAWISIASLFVLLRQVKLAAWPLRPLHEWYGTLLIPLAAAWGVLLAVYWNLRQDGNMSPLPYLPLINPLDITTGFVALLVIMVWRANQTSLSATTRTTGIKVAMALSFAWFNLMLLRTAAHYLHLPYLFNALYDSQVVQAMLSIVWTLTALFLMRFATKKLSKPLWFVGIVLLAVVVAKLGFVDQKNLGGLARIASFIGVGGLMLLIGVIAPFPRGEADGDKKELT